MGTSAKRERLLAWLDEENGDMYEVFAGGRVFHRQVICKPCREMCQEIAP